MTQTPRGKSPARAPSASVERWVYALEVLITSGPITEKFGKKNKVVSRTIQIPGYQTLEDLHLAIFDAFDREDEHMYEFQVGGRRPMDPRARRYVLPVAMEEWGEALPECGRPPDNLTRATIGSLGLKVGDAFGYWFDFGDDWWHQIRVVAIDETMPTGKFPRVTKRVGDSPPQYAAWDEEP